MPLKENWKHLAYDSEEDAVSKLKQIELEYVREQAAEPFLHCYCYFKSRYVQYHVIPE